MAFVLGELSEAKDGVSGFLSALVISSKIAYDEYNETQDKKRLVKRLQEALCAVFMISYLTLSEETAEYLISCASAEKMFFVLSMCRTNLKDAERGSE